MRSIIVILISLSVVAILVTPSLDDDVDAISVSNTAGSSLITLTSTEAAVERETMTLSQMHLPSRSSHHEVIRC